MPDPDAVITNRDLTDKIVSSRLLDDDLETTTFTATRTFTGNYETSVAAADTQRIQIDSGVIRQYTGDSAEVANGAISTLVSGVGDSRTLQMTFWGPSFLDDIGTLFLVLRSASFDDSTSPPGLVFGYTGASTQTPEFIFQAVDLRVQGVGKATFEGELIIPKATSDPNNEEASLYVNTSANEMRLFEGGAWRVVGSW